MSIQIDISDVLAEVGVEFSIIRLGTGSVYDDEYLTYTPNTQVTKPFVREHFLEVSFKSDTSVLGGDILTFTVSGDSYLVMNNTPDFFEDEIIRYLAVLYKTNVTIAIQRAQNTTVGYNTTFGFTTQSSGVKALLYAPLFGNTGEVDDDIGSYSKDRQELYLPVGYSTKENDRILVSGTTESYKVETVILRRFPNIAVVRLGEDTR